MNNNQTGNQEIKSPEAAGTDPEAILKQSEGKDTMPQSELHPVVEKGKGEPKLSSPTVQEAAKTYIQRGWYPVPVPYMQKGSLVDGWPDLRLTLDEVPRYFKAGPQNIGVILGEPSGGLVDIDLDVPEAIKLADAFLPETDCVFGRKGKPRSHRLYISKPIPEKRVPFETNEGIMLVELRSTGDRLFSPQVCMKAASPLHLISKESPHQSVLTSYRKK